MHPVLMKWKATLSSYENSFSFHLTEALASGYENL